MAAGGVPKDPKMARLVPSLRAGAQRCIVGARGVHLFHGLLAEELVEVTFAVGQMAGLDLL